MCLVPICGIKLQISMFRGILEQLNSGQKASSRYQLHPWIVSRDWLYLYTSLQGYAHRVFDWLFEWLGLGVQIEMTCITFYPDHGFSFHAWSVVLIRLAHYMLRDQSEEIPKWFNFEYFMCQRIFWIQFIHYYI